MHVPPDAVFVAPDDQAHLGVGFQPEDPIDHVDAFILQFPGPFDVVFLIESRLEFKQHRDLFPVHSRFH